MHWIGSMRSSTTKSWRGAGLEEKAVEAVKQWRFKPALGPSGKPVAVVVPIEVTFRLL